MKVYKHQDGWYKKNVALQARLLAILRKMEQVETAKALMVEVLDDHGPKQRMQLHCALIESYAHCGLHDQVIEGVAESQQISYPNASLWSYRSLLKAYTIMKRPHQAEEVLVSMKVAGMKPNLDDHKLVLETFSKERYLEDMERLFCEMTVAGLLDQAAFNMTLAAYSQANKHEQIVETLRVMVCRGMPVSVRAWNAICRACPVLNSICQSLSSEADLKLLFTEDVMKEYCGMTKSIVLSRSSSVKEIHAPSLVSGAEYILRHLMLSSHHLLLLLRSCGSADGELCVVQALLNTGLPLEGKVQPYRIDLHGMDAGTAFLVTYMWLRHTASVLEQETLSEAAADMSSSTVEIVTGWGRHSDERGKSLVKDVITSLLERMTSPFTLHRQNRGALVCRKGDVSRWIRSCMDLDS